MPEIDSCAYLLVSHGSSDPRHQIAINQLTQLVEKQILFSQQNHRQTLVGAASLEFASCPLSQSICQFAKQGKARGYQEIKIIPLFLLPGVHVVEDIPAAVALAQQELGSQIQLTIQPYLGSYSRIIKLLASQFASLTSADKIDIVQKYLCRQCHINSGTYYFLLLSSVPLRPTATRVQGAITYYLNCATSRILISHGSRRLGSNQIIEDIASRLNALAAYWSVKPSLAAQVATLVEQGSQQIAIVPYFLFSGGITDGIAGQIQQLQDQFPEVKLLLGKPLGVSTQLADLIVDLQIGGNCLNWASRDTLFADNTTRSDEGEVKAFGI